LRLIYGVIRREKSVGKRLVYYGRTPVTSWKNAKNDLKTSWQTHEKTLGAS